MRATLGFEQDVMREASNTLAEAENAAYIQQRRATRSPHVYQSSIYPSGTEYAVCQAEAQLMSAVVGVLNESLTEAIKSFYKLRKAYITLESVLAAESKYVNERSSTGFDSTGSAASPRPASKLSSRDNPRPSSQPQSLTGQTSPNRPDNPSAAQGSTAATEQTAGTANKPDDDDDDFVDADEERGDVPTPVEYVGHLSLSTGDAKVQDITDPKGQLDSNTNSTEDLISSMPDSESESLPELAGLTLSETVKENHDIAIFGDHPVDTFIISGSNFCFGILMLLVSLVPPSFHTLLKIAGFKGDRERGIQMLWQATKFRNIHGALAGLVLFGYYNGITGFCDIVPRHGQGSHPKERCRALLADMRERFPKSHLWLLEEARMMASDKKLEKAVEFMKTNDECPLKQLEALHWFELSLNSMYLHDFEGTSAAFQKCATLNNWSHGLYYYICGASHLELYRRNKVTDPVEAKKQAELATKFFKMAPAHTGKKKFMARQLPFDIFVNRKIQKWEARAAEWKCDFIDAVGVSPLEEIIYFWNGFKRMRNEHLEVSLESLAWSESEQNPYWEKEDLDEKAILALLRGIALGSMGKTDKAKAVLEDEILRHDRSMFKGALKDTWTAPCARYEMAVNLWREADRNERPEEHLDLLERAKAYLQEVSAWESFDLDARIGLRVVTGKTTLRRYGVEC
jgi:hypothetical protein